MEILTESHLRKWAAAANTLGKIGNEHTIDYLLQALDDSNPSVRATAAQALGEMGSEDTVPALLAQNWRALH